MKSFGETAANAGAAAGDENRVTSEYHKMGSMLTR
jgi:hypothetical protein